jgi:LuxR family maltose regulon positive regulatory protein
MQRVLPAGQCPTFQINPFNMDAAPLTIPPEPMRLARGLESKLNPPASTATQVLREALCQLITGGAGQLVLVRAPAGFGKSTAMAQALARLETQGVNTAWLTLDPSDNDVSRFLGGLDEAIGRLGAGSGDPRSPVDAIRALATYNEPFALFLDDFESVHEPAVLGLVREIIDQLPRRGHLVLGSRSLPALGLGRLRARGQLVEVDAERLRFSLEDTADFLARCLPGALSADLLFRLHEKTEGWIAALWLASMALERQGGQAQAVEHFVARFSGSERAVADYLAEDVLQQQPLEIRHFLLRTSILRQLDAQVCAALMPRTDCQRLLERLDEAHLFLTPVSSEQRTWRYHSLFADYLRKELQRQWPDELARLHLAASGWYESQGRPVPAIDHALEGGDHPLALTLLDQHAESFLSAGRMRLLSRWFAAIPSALLHQRPALEMVAVWANCFTQGPWAAGEQMEQALLRHPQDPQVLAQVACMRPMLLAMQDHSEQALEIGRESLKRLPTGLPFADSTLLNAMAHTLSVMGEPGEAQQLLDAARREQGSASTFHRMYTESTEGLLDLQQGRLRQATARFRLAVDATHAVNYHHTHGNAWAGVFYACAVYEVNQLDQADHLLNVYLPLARDVGLPDHMILSHAMRSRIAFVRGDVDAASLALTELEYLGHQRKLPRVVLGAKLERARLLLRQDNAAGARDELRRAEDPTVWAREQRLRLLAHDIEYLALARWRWQIAAGQAGEALPGLVAEIGLAEAQARNRRLISLRVLRSLALARCGDSAAAVAQIGQVLQQACAEGFMRLLLDEGPAAGLLVQRYQALHDSGSARDPILGDYLQRLLQAFGSLPSEADAEPAGVSAGLLEPLTRKELHVLQLLVEGYSNSAMAEKLFVSDSTVRTHLRNIFNKLGAHSRTQTVTLARRLGLIA